MVCVNNCVCVRECTHMKDCVDVRWREVDDIWVCVCDFESNWCMRYNPEVVESAFSFITLRDGLKNSVHLESVYSK